MRHIRRHLTYANVMVTILAFIVLGSGAAYATHLVVNSSDVVDDSLRSVDIMGQPGSASEPAVNGTLNTHDISGQAPSAANGTPYVDGALTQWDVQNDSLVGADVEDDSLRGRDVLESTLGQVPSASNASSLNGKSAAELEGARASAIVAGGNCDVNSGFCPIVRGKRVAYAFHIGPGKYCVGVNGIPATDPQSIALVSPTFPSPNQWGYWRWAVYGNNDACVGSEYEIYMIYQGDGFSDMRFTFVIP